jgi:hypothetical protein
LWGALDASIELGEKCLLVSDSSPDSLNTFYTVFKRKYPDKVIEVVHADSKCDSRVRDIVDHTTEALNRLKVDALLCSPSITNGVDFRYFDTVFVLTGADSHTPNLRFQALMRERKPKEIHYYFTNHKGYNTGYSKAVLDDGWLSKQRRRIAERREREFKTYVATFNYYLIAACVEIFAVDDPFECPKTKEDTEAFLIERANAVLTSSELHTPLRHNDAFELKKLIKSMYRLEDEPTLDLTLNFLNDEPHRKAKFFHSIAEEYWDVLIKNDPVELSHALKSTGHRFYLLTGLSLKTNPPRKILNDCGFKPKADITPVLENYLRYCNHFNLRLPDKLVQTLERTEDL